LILKHPTSDQIEAYALRRARGPAPVRSEEDLTTTSIEAHILYCSLCASAVNYEERYARAMRAACARVRDSGEV